MLLVEGVSDFHTAEQLRSEEELISNFLVDEATHPDTCNVVERAAGHIIEENTNNNNNVEPTTRVYVVR